MKKILFILFALITFSVCAQGNVSKQKVVSWIGSFTTTERNALDVPVGEVWMIYNSTTGVLEYAREDDSWGGLAAGAGDQLGADVSRGLFTVSGTGTLATINGNTITSAAIVDGAVGADDIATGAVGTDEIATGAVQGVDMANDAVTTGKIANGTILSIDLNATNTPTAGQVLSYNLASGNFTWIDPASGGGGTELLDPASRKVPRIWMGTQAEYEIDYPGGTAPDSLVAFVTDLSGGGGGGSANFAYLSNYGADGTLANDTTALRNAFNTGLPIVADVDTLVLDNMVFDGGNFIMINPSKLVIYWANDPGIAEVSRATQSMIEINNMDNVYMHGDIKWYGNEDNAFQGTGNAPMLYTGAKDGGDTFQFEGHWEFEDIFYSPWHMNRSTTNRQWEYVYLGDISLINAYSWRGVNWRVNSKYMKVGNLYHTDGDPNNHKQIAWGYGNVRGAFLFQGGEAAIFSSWSETLVIESVTSEFAKAGPLSHFAYKSVIVGDILITDFFRNSDGTSARWDSGTSTAITLTKLGYYTSDSLEHYEISAHYNSYIVKNTNNAQQVPDHATAGATTTDPPNVTSLQLPEDSMRMWVGYLETDCNTNLYSYGSIDTTGKNSEDSYFGTIVIKPTGNGDNNLTLKGRIVVDNLILDARIERPGETRYRPDVGIEGQVKINSISNIPHLPIAGSVLNGGNGRIVLTSTSLKDFDNGNVGWSFPSDIQISNANTDDGVDWWLNLTDTNFTVDGQVSRSAYFKCTIRDSDIQSFRRYTVISSVIDYDFSTFRDRVEFNVYNSTIRDWSNTGEMIDLWRDLETGLLTETSTAGAVTLTDNTAVDETLVAGTKDLPDGETVNASRIVNTILLDGNDPYRGVEFDNARTATLNRASTTYTATVNFDGSGFGPVTTLIPARGGNTIIVPTAIYVDADGITTTGTISARAIYGTSTPGTPQIAGVTINSGAASASDHFAADAITIANFTGGHVNQPVSVYISGPSGTSISTGTVKITVIYDVWKL